MFTPSHSTVTRLRFEGLDRLRFEGLDSTVTRPALRRQTPAANPGIPCAVVARGIRLCTGRRIHIGDDYQAGRGFPPAVNSEPQNRQGYHSDNSDDWEPGRDAQEERNRLSARNLRDSMAQVIADYEELRDSLGRGADHPSSGPDAVFCGRARRLDSPTADEASIGQTLAFSGAAAQLSSLEAEQSCSGAAVLAGGAGAQLGSMGTGEASSAPAVLVPGARSHWEAPPSKRQAVGQGASPSPA